MLSDICLEDRVIVHFINTTVTKSIIHPHSNNHGMIMETEYPQKQSSEPSEDQERFEETAKFEEEIEHRPSVTKLTTRKKEVAKFDSKLILNLNSELKKHSDASKKMGLTIRDVQKQIRESTKKDTKDHQIVGGLQAQVRGIQRNTDRIDRSIIS